MWEFSKLLTFKNAMSLLAAGTTMIFSYKRYKNSLKREGKEIYKVPILKHSINELLQSLEQTVSGRNVICVTAELTNGGGIPRFDKAIYIKALNSNNAESINLWGHSKTKCTPSMENAISKMYIDGSSALDISDFKMKLVETWGDVKQIEKVFYFLIGIDGNKRALLLSVNSDSKEDLTAAERLLFYNGAKKIKELINNSRKYFWQKSIV